MAEPERSRTSEHDIADVLRLSDVEKAVAEEIVEEELRSAGRPAGTDKDFFHALGGWGALLDIGLPWIAFLVVYWVTDDNLSLALGVAVAAAVVVAALRLWRRQPLRNIVGGFIRVL